MLDLVAADNMFPSGSGIFPDQTFCDFLSVFNVLLLRLNLSVKILLSPTVLRAHFTLNPLPCWYLVFRYFFCILCRTLKLFTLFDKTFQTNEFTGFIEVFM